jgi:hypothetical protein
MDRYFLTLAPAALLAAGYVVCFCVVLALRKEIRSLRSRLSKRDAADVISVLDLNTKLEEVSTRLGDAEERAGMLAGPAPPKSGLNFSKRSQAIRLSRRGEPAESIAASLSMPRRQVELLLKVQGIVIGGGGVPPTS